MTKRLLFVLAVAIAGAGCAKRALGPDPAMPAGKAPALEYRSAFEGYRRYAEPEVSGWREMNEEVGRIGGHAGMHRQGGHEGHK